MRYVRGTQYNTADSKQSEQAQTKPKENRPKCNKLRKTAERSSSPTHPVRRLPTASFRQSKEDRPGLNAAGANTRAPSAQACAPSAAPPSARPTNCSSAHRPPQPRSGVRSSAGARPFATPRCPPNADEDDGAGAVGSGSSRPGLGTREAAVRRDESFGRSGERAARSGEPERGRGGLSRRLARPRRLAVGFANRGAGAGAGAAGCRTSASSSDGEGGRVRRGVTRGRKGAASAAGRSGWWWGARGTTAGVRLR